MVTRRSRPASPGPWRCLALGCLLLLVTTPTLRAGGSPENLLVIIDPANRDSLYVGNYYVHARDIPDRNIIYMAQSAASFQQFAVDNLDALFGHMANKDIENHVDYIVLVPGSPYRILASGLISDGCSAVNRFSISSAYTMAFIADEILAGGMHSSEPNRFYGTSEWARAFSSATSWLDGGPSSSPDARRYFIGAQLGYSGERGNTVDETLAMIDRSVAADGTRPFGTVYFMNNTADPARNVRASQYADVVTAIVNYGGFAQITDGALPAGGRSISGIMTGAAAPAIDSTDMEILPGAFCDHLTSYAATFASSSQVKVSRWIAKGASGSWGAVEEPCNYTGKFPHARLHRFYLEGASLGESALRSAEYVPFQMLLYGDPMTRPFAHIPEVAVNDAPTGPASGTIILTPNATTTHPTASIDRCTLLIDGVVFGSTVPPWVLFFEVDTTQLSDGWHELRVLAFDNTAVRSTGRWVGEMVVDNRGRSASLAPTPPSGNLTTPFTFNVAGSGGAVREVRVVHNDRVVAAAEGSFATLTVCGLTLGAGPVRVHAEALFSDGTLVRSAPLMLDVAPTEDTPSGQPPVAYGFTKQILRDSPVVVELPATCDDGALPLIFSIVSPPSQTSVASGQTGAYRLMRPSPGASGVDTFTFQAASAAGDSNIATVKLVYDWQICGDVNCDGHVDFDDINPFVWALSGEAVYLAQFPDCNWLNADCNEDGTVDFDDINAFVALFNGGP